VQSRAGRLGVEGESFVVAVGRLNATAFAAGENDAEFAKQLPDGSASAVKP
jgi:hypothetical protein